MEKRKKKRINEIQKATSYYPTELLNISCVCMYAYVLEHNYSVIANLGLFCFL